jgi:hypothetical protein
MIICGAATHYSHLSLEDSAELAAKTCKFSLMHSTEILHKLLFVVELFTPFFF